MPLNNPALYDSALSAIAASNGAWIFDKTPTNYSGELSVAQAFANEIDSQIPTIASVTISQRQLLESIVKSIMIDRKGTSISATVYLEIAQAVAAIFTEFATNLQDNSPDGYVFSVPNLATLALLQGVAFGQNIRVETVGRSYQFAPVGSSIVDGITTINGIGGIYHTLNGTSDGKWSSQISWCLDNTGNDENDGSVARPIKTFGELIRRVGVFWQISGNVTVQVNNDIIDNLVIRPNFAQNTSLSIFGVPTLITNGTVNAAFPAVGNQPQKFSLDTIANWTNFGGQSLVADNDTRNVRIRITTAGPRLNAVLFAAKASPDAGDPLSITRTHETSAESSPGVNTSIALNDTVNIESIPNVGVIDIQPSGFWTKSPLTPPIPTVKISHLRINTFTLANTSGSIAITGYVFGCIISNTVACPVGRDNVGSRVGFYSSWLNIGWAVNIATVCCLLTSYNQLQPNQLQVPQGAIWESGHSLIQSASVRVFGLYSPSAGFEYICDSPTSGILNNGEIQASDGMRGYGNGTVGYQARAQSKFRYGANQPTITGVTGDILLDPIATIIPWSALPWKDGVRTGKTNLNPGAVAVVNVPYLVLTQSIQVTHNTPAGVGSPGVLSVPDANRTNTQFGVRSNLATDAGTFDWMICPLGTDVLIERFF